MVDSPDIVIIALDTMRLDALRSNGGKALTPNLDSIASDGVQYPNCIASSPWTVPSHASLFTGMNPTRHGVHETREKKGPDIFGTMAKQADESLPVYLSSRGYNCVGYSANPNITPGSGFEAGFHSFTSVILTNPTPLKKAHIARAKRFGSSKGEVAKNLLKGGHVIEAWRLYRERSRVRREDAMMNYPMLKGGDRIANAIANSSIERPFFLFVNLMEVHEPYLSGEPGEEPKGITDLFGNWTLSEHQMSEIRRKYVLEVQTADDFVGQIVQFLRDAGVYDGSLIVIVSDHGQSLKEKGYYGHGIFVHDELLRVPLVVKYPDNKKETPPPGHQTLEGITEMVKDSLLGMTGGESLTKPYAVSESYGINSGLERVRKAAGFEEKRDRFDRPRKAVYKGGWKLAVDGKTGEVIEFTKGGLPAEQKSEPSVREELLECLRSSGDRDFVYAAK